MECCSYEVSLILGTKQLVNTTILQPKWIQPCSHHAMAGLQPYCRLSQHTSKGTFYEANDLRNNGLPTTRTKLSAALLPGQYCRSIPCTVVTATFCVATSVAALVVLCNATHTIISKCRSCSARRSFTDANGVGQDLEYTGLAMDSDLHSMLGACQKEVMLGRGERPKLEMCQGEGRRSVNSPQLSHTRQFHDLQDQNDDGVPTNFTQHMYDVDDSLDGNHNDDLESSQMTARAMLIEYRMQEAIARSTQ